VGVFVYASGEGLSSIDEDATKHPERTLADNKMKTIQERTDRVLCIPEIFID
jgi:hypothetical protein